MHRAGLRNPNPNLDPQKPSLNPNPNWKLEFIAFWKNEIYEGTQVASEVAGLCAQMAKDLRMHAITDMMEEPGSPGSPLLESPSRFSDEIVKVESWIATEVEPMLVEWFVALDEEKKGHLTEEDYIGALDSDGKEDSIYLRNSWLSLKAEMFESGHGVVTKDVFVLFWCRSIMSMFNAMPTRKKGWLAAKDVAGICKENKEAILRPWFIPSFFKVPSLPLVRVPSFPGSFPSLKFGSDSDEPNSPASPAR